MPLQPELQKTLQVDDRQQQKRQEVEEVHNTSEEALPHPPLPMDTGLSPKKRRSYGNLSVHASGQPEAEEEEQEDVEDDTLLPLPTATEREQDDATVEQEEKAIRRNRPRATLVNSGALRKGPQPSSIPLPAPVPTKAEPVSSIPIATSGSRRPSLTTSTLGIKARRVSELVRASTPPLPSIADFSTLETPNTHLLLDSALPSPSSYGLADWTATDETSHVPGLNPHRNLPIAHSTPLAPQHNGNNARFKKSRYSGAQRIPLNSDTPKGLMPGGRKSGTLVAVNEGNGLMRYEDEHDSFRKGWMYEEEDQVELPDFSIENNHQQAQAVKKQKVKVKGRGSMKVVKPGPMARTFFR